MILVTDQTRIGAAIMRELHASTSGLAVRPAAIPDDGEEADLFVAALDGGHLEPLVRWESTARERGMRFLPVHVQGGEAIIGPEIQPDRAGCLACWITRYFGARQHARQFAQSADRHDSGPGEDGWLTPLGISILGALAARRIEQSRDRIPLDERASGEWAAYYFNLQSMTGRSWPVVPDSSCPHCGRLPRDSAGQARFDIEYATKYSDDADRLRPLTDLAPLREAYAGYRSNIVSSDFINWNFDCGAVVSVTVTLAEHRRPEPCSGFCATYDDAHTVAVLEGLERYSGVRPRGMRPSVRGTVASMGRDAIDPRLFALHAPHEYVAFAHALQPFSDDLEMDFVWAWSAAQRRPVLVPTQLAYYSLGTPSRSNFVIEGSIGCALGSSDEECVFHGMLEVIERDAFLLTWYAEIEPPRFDPMDCLDPEVRYRCRFLREQGYELFAFDLTTDHGIPAIGVLARRPAPRAPFSFFVSAAHIRPDLAIKKALRELTAASCRYRIELQDPPTARRAAAMVDDHSQVRTMEDHALFYCMPAASKYLDFLIDSPRRTSLAHIAERASSLRSRNLGRELDAVLARVIGAGGDVIVARQTPPEVAANGLRICKTLIAGAIPMTWGQHRRLEGLPRLDAALRRPPGRAGSRPRQPNPAPHPYP
jgi:ribosomal protein S12 methylthiotransferase accessory factor